MTIKTINPATGEVIQSYPEMTVDQVDQILQKVKNAQSIWRDFSFSARAEKCIQLQKHLKKQGKICTININGDGKNDCFSQS